MGIPDCTQIKKLYKSGKLENLIPLWHTNELNIDFNCQNEQLNPELLSKGYTIIPKISIDILIDSFQEPWYSLYRKRILFNEKNWDEWKTCGIIQNWLNQTKLIPASICWNDLLGNKTFPGDGRHRLNVAFYFRAVEVPIIIPNKQLKEVSNIIGI